MNTVPLWITLVGFAAPLITLAGSAVAYVVRLYQEAAVRRRDQLFELMKFIDTTNSIAAKLAAVYSLRNFTEHADFIVRFCQTQKHNVTGPGVATASLVKELELTEQHFQKLKSGS